MSPAGKETSALEDEVSEDTKILSELSIYYFKIEKNSSQPFCLVSEKDTWWWAMEFKIKRDFFFNHGLSAGPSTVIF